MAFPINEVHAILGLLLLTFLRWRTEALLRQVSVVEFLDDSIIELEPASSSITILDIAVVVAAVRTARVDKNANKPVKVLARVYNVLFHFLGLR